MEPIRVVVNGAAGRMGTEVVRAVCAEPDMQVVGAVELAPVSDQLTLPDGSGAVPYGADIAEIIARVKPTVVVDFTGRDAAIAAAPVVTALGVNLVIGATGVNAAEIEDFGKHAEDGKVGVIYAANFALGAVLMMHLSRIAAKFFDYVEITELHHEKKLDAPSGTALATARKMSKARGKPFNRTGGADASRGDNLDGVTIHSVRLPGMVAHQEVLFGGLGQTLSIRHDSINRESFMPGVVLAVREVIKRPGLTVGLDALLGL
jgi:4-hydroxy-tetrahydrodipicolinate reductase